MSWSYDDARALYRPCPGCGEVFCTEDPRVVENYYNEPFCSSYCLEQDERYQEDSPGFRQVWP